MSRGKFIKGTRGKDQLIGTSGNDFIISGKGNDEINAGAGHDVIFSGKGHDIVNGGSGNDFILTGKGNDIVTGGAGNDCVHLGKGNDTAIYVMSDNIGNKDFYHGGRGHDTLRLEFTKEEWLRPDIQADIAAYLAYLSGNTVPDGYWYNRSTFEFKAFNLTAKQFENLEVVVDGKLLNPADEMVDAVDDVVTVSENSTITGNVLENDDVPDLVKTVELLTTVTKGILTFNPDGTFEYETNGEFETLAVGETATQTFTYKVIDADGDEDTATVTLTITGENDAPVLQYSLTEEVTEDSGAQLFDLIPLDSLTEVDASDTHTVVAASLQQTAGRPLSSAMLNGNYLQYDPNEFNDLAAGESEDLTFTFTITDSNGGEVTQTLDLKITGENDTPTITVTNPDPVLEGNFDPQDPNTTDIQMLDVFAQTTIDDPDASDLQSYVANSIMITADAASATMDQSLISIDQTTGKVSYDRNAFNFLDDGESAIFNVAYDVMSGPETVTQTLVITISGENDAPQVRRPKLYDIDEDTSLTFSKADLLSRTTEFDLNDQGNLTVFDVELNGLNENDGILTDKGDNTWTFTPSENFNSDESGRAIRVNFKVSDGTATVAIDGNFRVNAVNDAPIITGALEKTEPEDSDIAMLDLLDGASDVEGDTLTVNNLTSPLPSGLTISGSILTIDPSDASFQHLAVGDSQIINLSYDIEDGNGGVPPQTAKITITGTNDDPEVAAIVERAANEDGASFTVDLLEGASDIDDGETATLTISNLSALPAGLTLSGTDLTVDPSNAAFQHLAAGATDVITLTYDVVDAQGASVPQTAKITITGTNDDPQVAAIIERAANEDDASFTVDLLEGASDIDDGETGTLSVTNVSPLPFGLMLNGNTINVDPSHTAFQHLAEGVDEVITVNYEIEDEQGAKVAQTAKITITGQNDLPEVGAIIEKSVNEDDDNFIVDLLESASDPDDGETQTLSVVNLEGLEAGLVQSGNTVSVDPSDAAFQSLAKDEPYIITLSYDIVDAQGDSTPQTAKITIIGKNDTPENQSPVASNATEDDAPQTIDLLPTGAITDIDEGDVLSVVAGTLSQTGGRTLSSAMLVGNTLEYNPNEFNDLGGAESESLTFIYDVTDSNGGTVTQILNLTVQGVNDAPVTVAIDEGQVGEDDMPVTINLLAGQTDPDANDVLTIENIIAQDNLGNPVTFTNKSDGTITIDPNQYDALNDGENRIVTVTYDVADGTTVTQNSATLEVLGATDNLPPDAVDDVLFEYNYVGFYRVSDGEYWGNNPNVYSAVEAAALLFGGQAEDYAISINSSIDPTTITHTGWYDGWGKPWTVFADTFKQDAAPEGYAEPVSDAWSAYVSDHVDYTKINYVWREYDHLFSEDHISSILQSDLLANDTDPDGDPLTLTEVSAISTKGAAVTLNNDGTISYDPTGATIIQALGEGETTTDTFTYTITDGNNEFDTATVTVTVLGQNDAPITETDNYIFNEDNVLNVGASAGVLRNDRDVDTNDILTATLDQNVSNGTLIFNSDGSFKYTPNLNFNGEDSFTYILSDGTETTTPIEVTLTVNPINDAPVVTGGQIIVDEDQSHTITLADLGYSDVDGDELSSITINSGSISAFKLDNNAITAGQQITLAQINAGLFTFAPPMNFNGTGSISFTASDGLLTSAPASLAFEVTPVNDTPVAVDDGFAVNADEVLTVAADGVLGNDTDIDIGDVLTVASHDMISALGATVTVNTDGSLSYDATGVAAIQALGQGETQDDTFTYNISDGNGGQDTATVTITVTGVNDAPEAVMDSASVDEDGSVLIDVLDNDSDENGDALTITNIASQANGMAVIENGQIRYTPNGNFSGIDTFTYTIDDGKGGVDTATVTVTVNEIADEPTLIAEVEGRIGLDLSAPFNIMAAVTDLDGSEQVTQIKVSGLPQGVQLLKNGMPVGIVSEIEPGVVFLNPIEADGDSDLIGLTIAGGGEGVTDFTLTVEATVTDTNPETNDTDTTIRTTTVAVDVNQVPIAMDLEATTNEDVAVTIDALATASDPDGDSLMLGLANTSPQNGTVEIVDNKLVYTPKADFSGQYSFDYQVRDGFGGVSIKTVTVNVAPVADTPDLEVTLGGETISLGEAVTLDIQAIITDIDDGPASEEITQIKISGLPEGATLNAGVVQTDGSVILTPAELAGLELTVSEVPAFDASFELSSLNGSNGFVLNGIDVSDQSGISVSNAGDINGDGIDDLIIGAWLADLNGDNNAGESYVVFGQDTVNGTGFSASFDLGALNGSNGFVLNGIDGSDQSGYSVSSAGDINGDGIDDLIIGAARGTPNGVVNAGESYVVFGQDTVNGPGFSASFDLGALNGSNGFVLNGIDGSDQSGFSVSSAGDINGDGIDDLIIGAVAADPNGDSSAGESYVVFGQDTVNGPGFSASFDLSSLNGSNGFVLNGIDGSDQSGFSVSSAGDINGDGIDDLIIGARFADPNGDNNAGESYVVFGQDTVNGPGFSASFDLSSLNGNNGFVLNGIDAFDQSGYSVSSAGDINGDDIDDLIIGARFAAPNGVTAGESYVVFGQDTVNGTGFSASFDLSSLNGSNGFILNGIDASDESGFSVSSAGDINGDDIDDLIIGARLANPNGVSNAGESYVVFGQDAVNGTGFSASFDLSSLNGSNGFILYGIDADDESGFSVSSAGDLNADGIDDLIIGARSASPNGDSNAGESYVVFGRRDLAPEDFQLTVEATVVDTNPDNAGDMDTAVGSITLDVDVNQNPTIEAASFTVDENVQQVGTISFSDPDGDDVTIALTSNAATDNVLFAIDPQTGLLTFIDSNGADFENPLDIGIDNIYDIEVEVTDSNGASTLEQFQVTVDDVGQAVLEISGLDPFRLGSILVGDAINASLVITNTGMEDATDLTIDFVDPNGPFSVTGGSITLDGDLQIGASEFVSFSFQSNVPGTFIHTLQVNYFNGEEFDITTRDVMGTAN